MAALADGMELFLHLFSRDASSKPVMESSAVNAGIGFCYVAFAFVWLFVWTKLTDKDFSATLTASSVVQLLGFLILTIKVRATKSVAGISSKTLEMYAIFFVCRLTATCWKNGYVPVDKSGQYVYQLIDICSFVIVMQLLWCLHKTHKHSYQAEQDTLPIAPMLPPCAILGFFVHAGLNRSQFFDTIWATSTNVDTLAMIPQLWMMSKIGGQVEGCTSHFIAALAVSRLLALAFWCTAYEDIAYDGSSSLAAKQIVVAHVIQLLFAADFLYYYLKARVSGKQMQLPEMRTEGQEI